MADIPWTILLPDVIWQLQAATDEDDPTAWVSSYKYNWWKFNNAGDIVVFTTNTVMSCLEHHRTVTGKAAPKYKAAGEYSVNSVMDLRNEISAHAASALNRTYTTSRRAAGLYMLWHASSKQVQETEDLEGVPDPSFVSLADVKKLFKPVMCKRNIGSGYDSSLPGLAGDGSYSALPHSAPPSPTPVLPFDNMSPDDALIPYLPPSAYPLHFRVPPLGLGMFAAPEDSAIPPDVAASFRYIPPSTTIVGSLRTDGDESNHSSPVEYSGNTLDPAYAMELSDDESVSAKNREQSGNPSVPIPTPGIGSDIDPAFGMELSDGECADATVNQLGPLVAPGGIADLSIHTLGPDTRSQAVLPGNDLDLAYEMDLSDDDWDPSAGLVLSEDEDVAAEMELSDDEEV
ncbi:hypothetical protein DXG01_016054 [Tephrocybe rancida]|nr:hypothetical protein DXG01_016054 [Tephrocybe rancida]